jgi:tryptophan 2,3-dioxygenase
MNLTYSSYLKIDELTKLQSLRSKPEEHDEMLFIIIHQAYELWFKQILHELDYIVRLLDAKDIKKAIKTQKRINTILKVLVHQIDILETMTPLEFLSFRDYLQNASGFQSYQFRELEFILGVKNPAVIERFETGSAGRKNLKKRLKAPALWDYFLSYLSSSGYKINEKHFVRNYMLPVQPSHEVQNILLKIYRTDDLISQFCELLVDFDEGLQEWRYRHVKMVERTIGSKTGTGGSEGVNYLKSTLFRPVFPDLWQIRSEFK